MFTTSPMETSQTIQLNSSLGSAKWQSSLFHLFMSLFLLNDFNFYFLLTLKHNLITDKI